MMLHKQMDIKYLLTWNDFLQKQIVAGISDVRAEKK